MNRYLYLNYRKIYGILANLRMAFYIFTGQLKKGEKIPQEHMFYIPMEGHWIEITWLPNPVNNPAERSCYIGHKGIVKKVYPDGRFDLTINGDGATLMVTRGYKFKYITNPNK